MTIRRLSCAVGLLASVLCAWPVAAQPLEVLHNFTGRYRSSGPAGGPAGPLLEARSGFFFGTTREGGRFNRGTIFRMTPSGVVDFVHEFTGVEGSFPSGALVEGSDGSLYGTTIGSYWQTSDSFGTVFRVAPDGAVSVLHRFGGAAGARPTAGLICASGGGGFYGTTESGGQFDRGTVFAMTPEGALTTLHHFAGEPADGAVPAAIVEAADGTIYGVTMQGGGVPCSHPNYTCGQGSAFRVTAGGAFTLLHRFGLPGDGHSPSSLVQAIDGNFYGLTESGNGGNGGTFFRMSPEGVVQILQRGPEGYLMQARDGSFYATVNNSIVWLSLAGESSTLHTFEGGADGLFPDAAVTPVPRDYDGAGRTDVAVFRQIGGSRTWYVSPSSDARKSELQRLAIDWGAAADVPVPADYDGDGQADIAVVREAPSRWHIRRTDPPIGLDFLFGGVGDVPIRALP